MSLDFGAAVAILAAMAPIAEKVAADALELSAADRAVLVERLLESLSGGVDPTVERAHLEEIRRRREAVAGGQG